MVPKGIASALIGIPDFQCDLAGCIYPAPAMTGNRVLRLLYSILPIGEKVGTNRLTSAPTYSEQVVVEQVVPY